MLNRDSNELKFGIDKILSPHFGNVSFCSTSATSSPVSTSSQAPSPNSNTSGIASPSSISPTFQFGVDVIYPWVYSTRYSDRPSAGPRKSKPRKRESTGSSSAGSSEEEKRPRTAFTPYQLDRLNQEFTKNRYLTEKRRQELAHELGLHESQIKIWFQNKRAKLKKSTGDQPHLNYPFIAQLAQSQAK